LEAIIHNYTYIVRLLLENGASLDLADLRSRRALILATGGRSDIDITRMLLQHGAKANSIAFDKRSPLLESIRSNQASKVALLLRFGADAYILEQNGMNLLYVAASKNVIAAIAKALLDSGISVDSQDATGRTPLQIAAEYSCPRVVQVLL
jgi:ankyrin repeat protein